MKLPPKQPVEIWGGMECTINRVKHEYFNQLDYSGHRTRNNDIDLFASLGLKKMRYPILWEQHQPCANEPINWNVTDSQLLDLHRKDIDVIAGLVHHGSGPAFVHIGEDSFAEGLAEYAGQVAQRFPWINYYTPVNEPLTTARFCGLYGLWYPHYKDDAGFCRILINECKATILAMAAIKTVNPNAKLIQTDDLGKVHSSPVLAYQAVFENERRWLSYDLLCGKVNADHSMWNYLIEFGITPAELNYFIMHPCPPDIIGINYYLTSERYIDECKEDYPTHTYGGNGKHTYADVEAVRVGKVQSDGLEKLLKSAWHRYGIPIAVTEVHLHCTREEQMRWLKQSWDVANSLINENIPIVAITPWALLGSFGWDQLLTNNGGTYEPGIFDISSGKPRPTVLAAMIRTYSSNKNFHHLVLNTPGWWQRSCRSVYGKDNFYLPVMPSGKVLVISGLYSAELADVCRHRCLHSIMAHETAYVKGNIWAQIVVDEYMEISYVGRNILIIALNKNLYHILNAGLDLFLDGESGYWEMSEQGKLRKQVPDNLPALQFLAG